MEEVETSIPARFEKIVRMYPERLAVKDKNRSLTYDQLNRAANRVAHAILAERGVSNEAVPLLFEHGIDMLPAILGILKAGKFYLGIDPSFPEERQLRMLEDSGASLLAECRPTRSRNRLGEPRSFSRSGRARMPSIHFGIDRNAQGYRLSS